MKAFQQQTTVVAVVSTSVVRLAYDRLCIEALP